MAFWGVEIRAGQPYTLSPDRTLGRLRISQATLGYGSSEKSTVVQCNVGKKIPVLLCSLLPGKAESIHLELEFQEDQGVTFSVIGPRSVYLTGYFVGKVRDPVVGDDESESFGEDIGNTDTEASNEMDDEDEYSSSFIDDGELKVLPPSPSTSEEAIKRKQKKKKNGDRKGGRKRLRRKFQLSDSEDDGAAFLANMSHDHIGQPIEDSDKDDQKPISSLLESDGTDKKYAKRKLDDIERQANDPSEERKLDAVVGQVTIEQPEDRKLKHKKRKSNKKEKESMDLENPPTSGKKEADSPTETKGSKPNVSPKSDSGGLIIEELDVGKQDGKLASSGRKVTVHYTGKLKKGGQIFESSIGKDPLKFRLGSGGDSVLKGLELGIEGMRVGGKRRLLIPPKLGYGSKGAEHVPPKSWLIMDVELLKVR